MVRPRVGTIEPEPRYHAHVTGIAAPERDIVSWEDLDRLVADLADQLVGQTFDVLLSITRGGMVPAGMLAYRLRLRDILVAAVEYYDDTGQPGPTPTFFQFPADPLLRGKRVLIVDETCDSGETMRLAVASTVNAGASEVRTAVGFKTGSYQPDFHALATESAIILPWDRELIVDGELTMNPLYSDTLEP